MTPTNIFIDYLLSIGYKIYENQWWMAKDKFNDTKDVELKEMPKEFSVNARTIVYLCKSIIDYDKKENMIYWGIANGMAIEHTDTLRYPLPKGVHPDMAEEKMKSIFNKNKPELIYRALFDSSLKLEM